jgi:segregation and condensation protein A
MSYNVKIDVFEGPFDLLLHLVRVNEMDIYDISISTITQQYLDYVKEMQQLDLEVAGDFLVMAATLISLKARTLMPPLGDEAEEDEPEEEVEEEFENIRSAQDLMRRLVEYRQFKELARDLSVREDEQIRVFYRNTVLPVVSDSKEPQELREDINLLFSAFARVLTYTEGRAVHHVTEEEYSVEEKFDWMRNRLATHPRLSLIEIFSKCLSKSEAITTFLAILEICRQRYARIRQSANFDDIQIVRPDQADDDDD